MRVLDTITSLLPLARALPGVATNCLSLSVEARAYGLIPFYTNHRLIITRGTLHVSGDTVRIPELGTAPIRVDNDHPKVVPIAVASVLSGPLHFSDERLMAVLLEGSRLVPDPEPGQGQEDVSIEFIVSYDGRPRGLIVRGYSVVYASYDENLAPVSVTKRPFPRDWERRVKSIIEDIGVVRDIIRVSIRLLYAARLARLCRLMPVQECINKYSAHIALAREVAGMVARLPARIPLPFTPYKSFDVEFRAPPPLFRLLVSGRAYYVAAPVASLSFDGRRLVIETPGHTFTTSGPGVNFTLSYMPETLQVEGDREAYMKAVRTARLLAALPRRARGVAAAAPADEGLCGILVESGEVYAVCGGEKRVIPRLAGEGQLVKELVQGRVPEVIARLPLQKIRAALSRAP